MQLSKTYNYRILIFIFDKVIELMQLYFVLDNTDIVKLVIMSVSSKTICHLTCFMGRYFRIISIKKRKIIN